MRYDTIRHRFDSGFRPFTNGTKFSDTFANEVNKDIIIKYKGMALSANMVGDCLFPVLIAVRKQL